MPTVSGRHIHGVQIPRNVSVLCMSVGDILRVRRQPLHELPSRKLLLHTIKHATAMPCWDVLGRVGIILQHLHCGVLLSGRWGELFAQAGVLTGHVLT